MSIDAAPAPIDPDFGSRPVSRRSAMAFAGLAVAGMALSGCTGGGGGPQLPSASFVSLQEGPGEDYIIGPLDELTIFVWRNPELGAQVQVRPDGRITTPLITDMPAVGKTPSMLAEDIKLQLSQYIQEPIVSVIVNKFSGTFSQQIRGRGDRKTRLDPLSREHDLARCDDCSWRPVGICRRQSRPAGAV